MDKEKTMARPKTVNVRRYKRYKNGQFEDVCKHKRSSPRR